MPGEKLRSDKFDTPSINWSAKNQVEQWNYFERVCKRIFKGPWKDMAKEEQAAHLQLWVGMEGDKLIQSWKLTEEQEKDPDVFFARFKAHFEPKCNHRAERHQMRDMRQDKDEPIDEYIARLRLQANRCDFGDNYDQRVIEQLIEGTNSIKVRKNLLSKDNSLTLDAAIEVARLEESANKSLKAMGSESSKATNNIDSIQTEKKGECTHCGGNHVYDPKTCPATGTYCNTCGRMGHWFKVCRGGRNNQNTRGNFRGNFRGRGFGGYNRGGFQKSGQFGQNNDSGYYTGRKQFSRGGGRWNNRGRGVHSIERQTYGQDQYYQDEYQDQGAYAYPTQSDREYKINDIHYSGRDQPQRIDRMTFMSIKLGISSVNDQRKTEAFARIQIDTGRKNEDVGIMSKVDTGAEGNTLPLRIFTDLFPDKTQNGMPDNTITKDCTELFAYNGTPIPQLGRITLACMYKGKRKHADFYIVDVEGPAIIGLVTCQDLGIVKLNCSVTTCNNINPSSQEQKYIIPQRRAMMSYDKQRQIASSSVDEPRRATANTKPPINSMKDLKEMYPDRFNGIGRFPGEYHIQLDPSAVPKHSGRANSCPINIVDDVKKQLDEMVDEQIIVQEPEPTDWCSNVAYSLKPSGKWRICLSPKYLNQYIKRTYHHTPTTEELTYKMRNAKIFSKLDARHGYWSVVLDHESSLLTTFNTPFGKYRYLRLPFGLVCSQDEFQKRMDHILQKCPGTIGIADDVCVFGVDDHDHDRNQFKYKTQIQCNQ